MKQLLDCRIHSIRAFLNRHGHATPKQAAKFIQMSPETAYKYLSLLVDGGEAHRTFDRDARGNKLVVFNIGPAPEAAKDLFDVQAVVKSWEPMRIVDPWMLPREFFQPTGITA
jgi:hypothetical protein